MSEWPSRVGTWPVKDAEERQLEEELERVRREKRKRDLRNAINRERRYESIDPRLMPTKEELSAPYMRIPNPWTLTLFRYRAV